MLWNNSHKILASFNNNVGCGSANLGWAWGGSTPYISHSSPGTRRDTRKQAKTCQAP